MKVLMITGDKAMKRGHERFDLQAAQVERLEAVYVGRGAWWPHVPQGHFDVVTTQDPFWRGLLGLRIARRVGARLNVQVHADLSAQSVVKRILARAILWRADSVRVVSEKLKEQVLSLGVKTPIIILPIFIDLTRFASLPRNPRSPKTVLWIGRFEAEKDPLRAIEVLKEIRAKGVDAHLVMLGEGSLSPQIKTAARDLPVEFPGWQDPATYLPQATVVLSTSRAESYGASIIEALAAGVPVVAPDVGVAREAGATVVDKSSLAEAVVVALESNTPGVLRLRLLSREEWAEAWKKSL